MNHVSLFSDRGLRLVNAYTGPMEPPTHPDDLRDEAIWATEAEIWADPDWLEAACAYNLLHVSTELCQLLVPIRIALGCPLPGEGIERTALRALIECVDKEVRKAAERHVEDNFEPPEAA